MLFSIGSVKKFLGVPAETLRFFEKSGIVVPKRNQENNYRYYDGPDINQIIGYQYFRSLDFPMQTSIDIMQKHTNEEALQEMELQEKRVEAEIRRQQQILKQLKFQKMLYQRGASMVDRYQLEELPGYLFYHNQNNRVFEPSELEKRNTQKWIRIMPRSFSAFHIPINQIKEPGKIHWGHAIHLEENSEDWPTLSKELPYSVKAPSQTAIFTVLKCVNEDLKIAGRFDKALAHIESQQLAVNGDVFGTIINQVPSEKQGYVRYFATWIPVKKI